MDRGRVALLRHTVELDREEVPWRVEGGREAQLGGGDDGAAGNVGGAGGVDGEGRLDSRKEQRLGGDREQRLEGDRVEQLVAVGGSKADDGGNVANDGDDDSGVDGDSGAVGVWGSEEEEEHGDSFGEERDDLDGNGVVVQRALQL